MMDDKRQAELAGSPATAINRLRLGFIGIGLMGEAMARAQYAAYVENGGMRDSSAIIDLYGADRKMHL